MKRVLSLGQCVPDAATLRRFLERHFAVEVTSVDTATEAVEALRRGAYDLVLINRKLDVDYSDGIEVLKSLRGDPSLSAPPIMIVSNYPEVQAEAVAAGGVPGFGKLEYQKPETLAKLRPYLETSATKAS